MAYQIRILCDDGNGPLTACLSNFTGKAGADFRDVRMAATRDGWVMGGLGDFCPRHAPPASRTRQRASTPGRKAA